jgi:hypothetical protein
MSSDTLRKETDAFLSFFSAFELARPVSTIVDLSDGAALLQVLTLVYGIISPDSLQEKNIPNFRLVLAIQITFGNKHDLRLNFRTIGLSDSVRSNDFTGCLLSIFPMC